MMQININTESTVKFTNRLEKLHRSALPTAIRQTLNKAAFDVKQNTMPVEARASFEQRQPNFFKATSRVQMANGWSVKSMKATVGFIENGLKGGDNYAVKDLEQQERGGTIKGRSFIPTDVARGGSSARPVRPSNRISRVRRVVNAANARGKTRHEKFIRSAIYAGKGGYVIGNFDKKVLWRIGSIRKTGRGTRIRMKAIYSFEAHRSVHVSGTGFMRSASLRSASKMERFFAVEAKKQIERLMK